LGIDIKIVGGGNRNNRGRVIDEIGKGVIVAGNKIDSLTRHVNFGIGCAGDIFPPPLSSFGIVVPGAGQKTETEIDRVFAGFIGFDLVGEKKIDNVVDVGNGGDKNG